MTRLKKPESIQERIGILDAEIAVRKAERDALARMLKGDMASAFTLDDKGIGRLLSAHFEGTLFERTNGELFDKARLKREQPKVYAKYVKPPTTPTTVVLKIEARKDVAALAAQEQAA